MKEDEKTNIEHWVHLTCSRWCAPRWTLRTDTWWWTRCPRRSLHCGEGRRTRKRDQSLSPCRVSTLVYPPFLLYRTWLHPRCSPLGRTTASLWRRACRSAASKRDPRGDDGDGVGGALVGAASPASHSLSLSLGSQSSMQGVWAAPGYTCVLRCVEVCCEGNEGRPAMIGCCGAPPVKVVRKVRKARLLSTPPQLTRSSHSQE